MLHKRMNASACAFSVDDGVFVFGGQNEEGNYLASIEVYYPEGNVWQLLDV
jgi:hypothetical protein